MQSRKIVRLLVVDDHEAYCELIRDTAEMWNPSYELECRFADTAHEGLENLKEWSPTVVLVDAYLPDMNCLEFLDHCQISSAPLVVTSEHPSPELQNSVISRGAAAFVSKTSDPDTLETMLHRIAFMATESDTTH